MAFKVAYHMEGWRPDQLIYFQKHHERSFGDLDHCDPSKKNQNEVIHGGPTWAEDFIAEVEMMSVLNMKNEALALRKAGRPGPAKRVERAGPQDPWKASQKLGGVRSVVVSADEKFFRKAGLSDADIAELEGADFRDPVICRKFKELAVSYLDSEIPREHCLFMVWEMDEKTPHLHAYYACWNEKETKGKGRQRMLQPTDMLHFRNAEKAQTSVAEWFKPLGLDRGDNTAQKRREAKAAGKVPPEKKQHVPPWLYRRQQRAENLQAAELAQVEQAKLEGKRRAAEAFAGKVLASEEERKKKDVEAEKRRRKQDVEAARRRANLDAKASERRKELARKAEADAMKQAEAEIAKKRAEVEKERAAVAKERAEVDRKREGLVEVMRAYFPLAETIRAAARKVGLADHPLIQSAGRAVDKMRDLVGRLGGEDRGR